MNSPLKDWFREHRPAGWAMYFCIMATAIAIQMGIVSPRDKQRTETSERVNAVRANVAEFIVEINDDKPVMVFRYKRPQEISDELFAQKAAVAVQPIKDAVKNDPPVKLPKGMGEVRVTLKDGKEIVWPSVPSQTMQKVLDYAREKRQKAELDEKPIQGPQNQPDAQLIEPGRE